MIPNKLGERTTLEDAATLKTLLSGGRVRVYNSANISISSGAWAALSFDSERWDNEGAHSTASNTSRLTAQAGGLYIITGGIRWAANATGSRLLAVRLNGTTYIMRIRDNPISGAYIAQSIMTQYELATDDYVELMVYQDSGGALNIENSGNTSPEFMMVRVL